MGRVKVGAAQGCPAPHRLLASLLVSSSCRGGHHGPWGVSCEPHQGTPRPLVTFHSLAVFYTVGGMVKKVDASPP